MKHPCCACTRTDKRCERTSLHNTPTSPTHPASASRPRLDPRAEEEEPDTLLSAPGEGALSPRTALSAAGRRASDASRLDPRGRRIGYAAQRARRKGLVHGLMRDPPTVVQGQPRELIHERRYGIGCWEVSTEELLITCLRKRGRLTHGLLGDRWQGVLGILPLSRVPSCFLPSPFLLYGSFRPDLLWVLTAVGTP